MQESDHPTVEKSPTKPAEEAPVVLAEPPVEISKKPVEPIVALVPETKIEETEIP